MTNLIKRLADRMPVLGELREIRRKLPYLGAIHREASRLADLEVMRWKESWFRDSPRYSDPLRLHMYGFQANSQNDEDGMIEEIFRRIGIDNKVFFEAGCGDGTENNTAFLLARGWSGFWIDGSPNFLRVVSEMSPAVRSRLTTAVELLDAGNCRRILANMKVPEKLDLLSLDIDQNTYYLWEALAGYAARVVVVEYNASLPPSCDWKVDYDPQRVWRGSMNFGASLKAYEKLGERLGYNLVGCDLVGTNAFFVRRDLLGDKFKPPFTAENHYEPPRYQLAHRTGHRRDILDGK